MIQAFFHDLLFFADLESIIRASCALRAHDALPSVAYFQQYTPCDWNAPAFDISICLWNQYFVTKSVLALFLNIFVFSLILFPHFLVFPDPCLFWMIHAAAPLPVVRWLQCPPPLLQGGKGGFFALQKRRGDHTMLM